jgi:hypothetical protein
MKAHVTVLLVSGILLSAMMLCSCAGSKPVPDQPLEFDIGMKTLTGKLIGQLEKSSLGKTLNRVIVNLQTKRGSLQKISIDPFIDTESGCPVQPNERIHDIIAVELARRFAGTAETGPKDLEIAEYVVTGMVSPEAESEGGRKVHRVYAAVYERSSGVVHASAEVRILRFDASASPSSNE